MSIFNLFKPKRMLENNSICSNEQQVLELLLAGDNQVLRELKTQLTSGFILRVERAHGLVKCIAGIKAENEKARYQLQFILPYDKSFTFSFPELLSFRIDDLIITNKSDGREMYFELIIHENELSALLGVVLEGGFPFDFEIGDWNYKKKDSAGKILLSKERDFSKIPVVKSPKIPEKLSPFQEWILEQKNEDILNDKGEKLGLGLKSAVSADSLKKFKLENEVGLPGDYQEFLGVTNGCNFFGENIFGIQECFRVDDTQFNQFIPFHSWVDGNFTAFNIEENFSVYYVSHDPLGYFKIAESFEEWLKGVKDEIKEEGRLVYPSERKKGTMYNHDLISKS